MNALILVVALGVSAVIVGLAFTTKQAAHVAVCANLGDVRAWAARASY